MAADDGGLRDYAHREWNGLLKDFYYMRWKIWFEARLRELKEGTPVSIDFYALEEPWTKQQNSYAESNPQAPVVDTALRIAAEALD